MFVLLVAEMAMFVALIIPLPYVAKRKLFNFISESPLVAKLQYGMKVGQYPRACQKQSLTYKDNLHIHPDSLRRQCQ